MRAPYPCGFIGDGLTRGVILALPRAHVCALLPAGLRLGDHNVTPAGTHPVIFQFHDFVNCQWSFPTWLQPMQFHEQTVGIPFTYLDAGGPYFFMPKLYLDDLWVQLNGRFWWGFDKEMAAVQRTTSRYAVNNLSGRRIVSLDWTTDGEDSYLPAARSPVFEPFRRLLDQTLISAFPAASPCFSLTDFDRNWNLGKVRPLRTVLDVDPAYMPGFSGGHFPAEGAAYEFSAPWWLSLPYSPGAFDMTGAAMEVS
ncbi:MAG TPA: acetoacetate decarboxylase family protein [Bryobacteraceae bacterium]|nr:acetoacetate decarboxylase family protein [Bryobacteraceae bacterium]